MRPIDPAIQHVRDHLTAIRIPRLFAHFFDVHFLEEKGVAHFKKQALYEMTLAVRFAILLADQVLVPAASYYESAICRDVLTEYPAELFSSQIALVASGANLDEFIEDKLRQYRPNQPQGRVYRAPRILQAYPWRRRQRSAGADIKSDWRRMLDSGAMDRLFEIAGPNLPKSHERIFEVLPDRLGESAFIVPNAIPLLFEGKLDVPITVKNALHAIVNQAYFGSYAEDLRAAVFQNMNFLQSSIRVPSGDSDHDVDYKRLERACRHTEVLADIMSASMPLLHHLADDPRFVAACVEALGASQRERLFEPSPAARRSSQSGSHQTLALAGEFSTVKILIVTALPLEAAAVRATFDQERKVSIMDDPHIYLLGTYHLNGDPSARRDVLLVTQSDMGKVNAAIVAANAMRSFAHIEHIIMVGIAGGCPNPDKPDEHVRLGDIVVSNDAGIIEYDDVKATPQGTEFRGAPQRPSYAMLQGVRSLETEGLLNRRPWEAHITSALAKLTPGAGYSRPVEDTDVFHDHNGNVVRHPTDPRRQLDCSKIHAGGVATADTLQKNPLARDELRDRFRVRAIEMEGSGIQGAAWAKQKDVIVVRGICDYCDAFKNDMWQPYAALAAAGYARALVEALPSKLFE
jgi:nucleoside phosphorylase